MPHHRNQRRISRLWTNVRRIRTSVYQDADEVNSAVEPAQPPQESHPGKDQMLTSPLFITLAVALMPQLLHDLGLVFSET